MKAYPVRSRVTNKYLRNGKPLVVKAPHLNGDYLQETISSALQKLGGIDKSIKAGESVILKPNFNCSEPTPLSTSLDFLTAVIEIFQDHNIHVKVGEMCGRAAWPTETVIEKLGVRKALKRYDVEFINFEKDQWIPVEINGEFWQKINVPKTIYEAEHRVYLPNMRCHSSARFTGAMKLGVGWISPDDREIMHSDKHKTEAMIGELNLAFQPDIVIMDARRSTITWAGRGDYVYPNLIMASGDMLAIDTEAVKILKQFPEKNRIGVPFDQMKTFTTAEHHKLGSMDYEILNLPANSATKQSSNFDPAALAVMNDL